ncbi:MotA/TolQ/ExbB proton channel [Thermoanaerobacter mathranii subsp. mathranii str. A3]|uniref:MotA/TolQ/ExbB proton channel n=1 Tax=Thermoanaerobacter mathranii subsp. mathranii (strain DSM 11426 / CCUG 53645 / CIP 108742 / A3) TaxID=583358 RepID=A0ABN3Z0W6_THEM3|nr:MULTISPECIES: motility protein A [Thermoanaerobacter]ADH60357.1 MotA/TolQ/ExbB proton channel [Thermoanaerobacter mathranii subsp. mathranii str. A3]
MELDIATVVGIVVAVGAIVYGYTLGGGTLDSLIDVGSAILVIGGTIGATIVSYSMDDIKKVPRLLVKAFKNQSNNYLEIIKYFAYLAQKARSEGLLSLESEMESEKIKNFDPILKECLELVVDGSDMELIKTTMENKIYIEDMEAKKEAGIFEAAGGYAPTMGLIGTVVGLIKVLLELDDPSQIGPSVSLAFITTLYGALLANLFFLPIAQKLRNKASIKRIEKELILEGSLSLQAGENPRILERKLMTFITQAQLKNTSQKGGVELNEEMGGR